MVDFTLALPDEVCAELGARVRTRRILKNLSIGELSQRVGVTEKTVGNLERTGRCTLDTFVKVLEALNAMAELQSVLAPQTRSIEQMRAQVAAAPRKRAYKKRSKAQ